MSRINARVLRLSVFTAACLLAGVVHARPQCDGGLLPGSGYPGVAGVVGEVYCSTLWDPDGPGPRAPLLVIGGSFTIAGNLRVSNIAACDLSMNSWQALGSGALEGEVDALATLPNGDLVAGGSFISMGGTPSTLHIARWNGTTWSSMGAGAIGEVYALATMHNGDLVAGGAGGQPTGLSAATTVAKWDGVTWSALGTGRVYGEVYVLRTLANGDLIAGGFIASAGGQPVNNIARWNGVSWSALATGLGSSISSSNFVAAVLELPNGDLVAGGAFAYTGSIYVNSIARWNGTQWLPLARGWSDHVYSLLQLPGGDLLAGNYSGMSRWDGTAWGTNGVGAIGRVYTLLPLPGGSVFAGGTISRVGNILFTLAMAQWNGQQWSAPASGPIGTVSQVVALPSGEAAAFMSYAPGSGSALPTVTQGSGNSWAPIELGSGYSFATIGRRPNGHLFAIRGHSVNGVYLPDVAEWDGTSWSSLTSTCPLSPQKVAFGPSGNMVISGSVPDTGSVGNLIGVARWNGAAWSLFGGELRGGIRALFVMPNSDVVAAGEITLPGDLLPVSVARWNGTEWAALGTPPPGGFRVSAQAANGDIVGTFETSEQGATPILSTRVSRWNGLTWTQLGSTITGAVSAVAVRPNGGVCIGGSFSPIDGVSTGNVGVWSGNAWIPLVPRFVGSVFALDAFASGDLAIGGSFFVGGPYVSNNFGRYHFGDTNPVIVRQPSSGPACRASGRSFDVVAAGSDSFSYQWQARGGAGEWVSLGALPSVLACGGLASSAQGTSREAVIRIQPCPGGTPLATQAFQVRCLVTDSCGTVVSGEAVYTMCPADFNCSGTLSAQDIFDYLSAWFAHDARADVNASGAIDSQDIFDFVLAWFGGC